MNHPSGPVVQV